MTQTLPEAVRGAAGTGAEPRGWWSRRPWLHVFLGGLGLWVATVIVTFTTANANLVPTIILLGSFLVPVAFVTYAFGHADQVVTAQRIFTAFVSGGSWACSGPRSWRRPSCGSRPGRPMRGSG